MRFPDASVVLTLALPLCLPEPVAGFSEAGQAPPRLGAGNLCGPKSVVAFYLWSHVLKSERIFYLKGVTQKCVYFIHLRLLGEET